VAAERGLPPLVPGTILLLTAELDPAPGVVEFLEGLLSPEERDRVDRLRLPHVRRRILATRGWVRWALGLATGSDPHRLVFRIGLRGKPFLDQGPSFNLAHTGDHLVLALAAGGRLGVDAEEPRPLPDLEALARRVFTAGEQDELGALPPGPERVAAFLRGWTRKEALLKAMGVGLAFPPRRFSVDLLASEGQLLRWIDRDPDLEAGERNSGSRTWFLMDAGIAAPPGGAAAVAWDQHPQRLHVMRLPPDPSALQRPGRGDGMSPNHMAE
jgi:4'-phosphopantetheinyl transferase